MVLVMSLHPLASGTLVAEPLRRASAKVGYANRDAAGAGILAAARALGMPQRRGAQRLRPCADDGVDRLRRQQRHGLS
jgi:hypothetical protein